MDVSDSDDRETLLAKLTWKIGLPNQVYFDDLAMVAEFSAILRETSSNMHTEEQDLRGKISNLFAAVENSLSRALIFSTWALTSDHFIEEDGFTYDPALTGSTLSFINKHAPVVGNEFVLAEGKQNSLAALASGFARLAKALRALDENAYKRPESQEPLSAKYTGKPFAFKSTIEFFNLGTSSREAVLDALCHVASDIQNRIVLKVRNSTIHGNSEFPAIAEIFDALVRIDACVQLLSSTGLYPQIFVLSARMRDDLGRTKYSYVNRDNEVSLFSPMWSEAPGLPVGVPSLVIFESATTISAGPLRFRIKHRPGDGDPYWKGWPHRLKAQHNFKNDRAGIVAVDAVSA